MGRAPSSAPIGREMPKFGGVPFAGGKRLGRLLIERQCIARRASALGSRSHEPSVRRNVLMVTSMV